MVTRNIHSVRKKANSILHITLKNKHRPIVVILPSNIAKIGQLQNCPYIYSECTPHPVDAATPQKTKWAVVALTVLHYIIRAACRKFQRYFWICQSYVQNTPFASFPGRSVYRAGGTTPHIPRPGGGAHVCSGASCYVG